MEEATAMGLLRRSAKRLQGAAQLSQTNTGEASVELEPGTPKGLTKVDPLLCAMFVIAALPGTSPDDHHDENDDDERRGSGRQNHP
ncbi:hypothetical protein IAQ61_000436 [Plenodomus lingam]|uniref:uncharacterized protein n=1 Tax=Leptosphaeria maculans TaxID=5022 RepID=UPI00332A518D|nr:hypothetical protein IAQ61_000436 [Plenodomus lingam]